MIDEELLKPSREHLARLGAEINKSYQRAIETASMYPDNEDHARAVWRRHHAEIEPLLRERDAVIKIMADYYGLQPMPPQIVAVSRS